MKWSKTSKTLVIKMKVSTKHREVIRQAILVFYTKRGKTIVEDWATYEQSRFSMVRFCFDLLAASFTSQQMTEFYKEYNDGHLLTATKQVVRVLLAKR